MNLIKLNSKGDTIVEVLLSIAILSLVLSASYGLASTSTKTNIASRERSEAQKLSERQLELLRGYVSPDQGIEWENDVDFCFREADGEVTQDEDECRGLGDAGRYDMKIMQIGDATEGYVYTIYTSWVNLKGGNDELKLSYKLPATGDIDSSGTPALDPECSDGFDNDSDGKVDYPADDGCDSAIDNTEYTPPPAFNIAAISGTSSFPAWHLAKSGGIHHSVLYRITNDASVPIKIDSTGMTGDVSSFPVISNSCVTGGTGVTLAANGGECDIRIEFAPPSGSNENRFSKAGPRSATLTITNTAGADPTTASLSGFTVSDRLGPGDELNASSNDQIRSFTDTDGCYNNAMTDTPACNHSKLIMFNGGLLASYHNNAFGAGSMWWGGMNTAVKARMQMDGNFALINSSGGIVCNPTCWNTGSVTTESGIWLYLKANQRVERKKAPWNNTNSGVYGTVNFGP